MREPQLIFTEHALIRITEPSITTAEEIFALSNFTFSYPTRSGRQVIECAIRDRVLKVWFAYPTETENPNVVLTAAWKGE